MDNSRSWGASRLRETSRPPEKDLKSLLTCITNPEPQEDGNVDEALEEHGANLKMVELRLVCGVRAGSSIRKKACEIANMLHDARIIFASAS